MRGRCPMTVFDDDMATAQAIPEQALDSDGHRRTSLPHPNHREAVILAQIIGAVGHVELISRTPYLSMDRLTGVHGLESGLENGV